MNFNAPRVRPRSHPNECLSVFRNINPFTHDTRSDDDNGPDVKKKFERKPWLGKFLAKSTSRHPLAMPGEISAQTERTYLSCCVYPHAAHAVFEYPACAHCCRLFAAPGLDNYSIALSYLGWPQIWSHTTRHLW